MSLNPHPWHGTDMPGARTLLIFDLGGALFGVDATLVSETVWLPELTPVEDAPPHIVGLFSLRGHLVPVTDIHLRFGHPARPYLISDQIVVLEQGKMRMGVIVNEVREVIAVECETENAERGMMLQADSLQSAFGNQHAAFEMVRVGDDLVTLLDASQLMHQPHPHPNLPPVPSPQSSGGTTDHSTKPSENDGQVAGYPASGRGGERERQSSIPAGEGVEAPSLARSTGEGWGGGMHFCPQATPEEHAAFRARARALMEVNLEEGGEHLKLAVVMLGNEYFGIELQAMQEFCDMTHLSPIPCCPPHILGAISLRGNLLTVLDLRAALNLSRATNGNGKVVVARVFSGATEQAVGVAVDEVCDVVYLRQEELLEAPATLREHHGAEIKGVASFAGKMMAVLDLPTLLAREEWIVNETV